MLYHFLPEDDTNGTLYAGLFYEKLEEAEEKLKEINKDALSSGGFLGRYKIVPISYHFKLGLDTQQVSKIVNNRMFEYSRGVYQGESLSDGLLEKD
jgi:hypothetical protein